MYETKSRQWPGMYFIFSRFTFHPRCQASQPANHPPCRLSFPYSTLLPFSFVLSFTYSGCLCRRRWWDNSIVTFHGFPIEGNTLVTRWVESFRFFALDGASFLYNSFRVLLFLDDGLPSVWWRFWGWVGVCKSKVRIIILSNHNFKF